jgi:lysozyme
MADQPKAPGKKTLVSIVGAGAAAILLVIVPNFEGTIFKGYRDPIGIATKCSGDTKNVVVGQAYSKAECQESLENGLVGHAEPVLKCTPVLKGRTYQLAAAVSWAYNIGTSAYCDSTTARRFNDGDFRGACRAMNESDSGRPQWVYAGGKILPGLVKRRSAERALCEKDLP